MTAAAIYVRISRDPEGLRAGVDRQRVDCEVHCREKGWTVAGVFEDNVDINATGPTTTVFGTDEDDVQARTIEQASAKARARIALSKALHGDPYS